MGDRTGKFQWRKDVTRTVKQDGYDPYNSVGAKTADDYVEIDPLILVSDEEGVDDHYWRTKWGMLHQ